MVTRQWYHLVLAKASSHVPTAVPVLSEAHAVALRSGPLEGQAIALPHMTLTARGQTGQVVLHCTALQFARATGTTVPNGFAV